MGMGTVSSGGGGSRRGRRKAAPMAEINVTPFVDVMLVLLIIFMVAAPLLTVGVPIDMPETRANPLQGDEEPLAVSVDSNGQIFLQDTEIQIDELVPRLEAIASEGYDQRVFVRGARDVDYGTVARVMARISEAGFTRIGLVTEQELEGQ